MNMEEMKWYVIRCTSGKEKKAKKHIEDEVVKKNLNESVSRLVIPTMKEMYIRNGKKVNREINYYPGYVLIEANLKPELRGVIKETQGVINILGTKENPSPIRDEEVKRILSKIDNLKDESSSKIDFIIGESVIISDGPFTNFNASIEEINEEKKRLKVGIKIFGRKTLVDIDYSQVIKN